MYKTYLILNVYNAHALEGATRFTSFTQELQLPFVPTQGLGLTVDYDRSATIARVDWCTRENIFRVYLEDRFEESDGMDDITYDDWIEHFTDRGWDNHGELEVLN